MSRSQNPRALRGINKIEDLGFEGVDAENVQDLLDSTSKEMTNEDLLEIEQQPVLEAKALSLYSSLKENKLKDEKLSFNASKGWFENFNSRTGLKNVKIAGEASSADEKAASMYPSELQKIIDENDSDLRQIFNVDETGLFWKKVP